MRKRLWDQSGQRSRGGQRGIGVWGLIFGLFLLILVSLLAMKLTPSYLEYFSIKKALNGIAVEKRGGGSASVAEIRRSFDARATIDDFTAVKGADLEITKSGNDVVISAAYRKEVKLFANIGIYIDFEASSRD
jgi:hypothetical protein